MRKADLLTLFDHMYWATQRILDAAEQLSVDEFVASSSVTTRDLRATLVHELDVEWSWRLNLQGRLSDDEADLSPDDYPDVAAIREHWSRDEADMRAWLEELSDELLAADVVSGLTDSRRPLWQYLVHIVTHAAQQQADAATLLSLAGRSPGELGFLEYLSTRA
ncbi:MAG: DinB family protein [Chloroflexi bacterium]|nr:DinB family protein [Chloroflexota bacterium]